MEQPFASVLLFGAPGVGKGTQGSMLGHVPGFVHVSMGDILRALDPSSQSGQLVRSFSSRGELVPDELTIQIWGEHIERCIEQGAFEPSKDLLVLDGVPRSPAQATLLEGRIDVLRLIHLVASDRDAMIQRLRRRALQQGRADDADERVIRHRWEVYEAETVPVLDQYPAEHIIEIDAQGAPAEVLIRVLGQLAPLQAERLGNALE